MFTVFTYIAPLLQHAAHASSGYVTAMLVVYGVGLTLGNWIGGRAADRSIRTALLGAFGVLAASLLALALLMGFPVVTVGVILVWGAASFAIIPPLQVGVMTVAREAPDLASSINIGAFNFGNAAGAALGGGVIGAGLGYPAVAVAGALTALVGLAMSSVVHRRRK